MPNTTPSVKSTVYPPYWKSIEVKHRQILATRIEPSNSILDLECGPGNLLHLLPTNWKGQYLGIDVRSNLIDQARLQNPFPDRAEFEHCSIEDSPTRFALIRPFDWIICTGIRMRVLRNLSVEHWNNIQTSISTIGKRLLCMEYDDSEEVANLTPIGIEDQCSLERQDLPFVQAKEDLYKALQALEEGDRVRAAGMAYSASLRLSCLGNITIPPHLPTVR